MPIHDETTAKPTIDPLLAIGEQLRTQDNRCTDNPMFIVQQQRSYGCEPGEGDIDVWLDCDWREVDKKTSAKLDRLNEKYSFDRNDKEKKFLASHTQRGVKNYWEFCMAAFTEAGCKRYLELNGHNLTKPRIYAESWNRCPEMLAVRKFLMEDYQTDYKAIAEWLAGDDTGVSSKYMASVAISGKLIESKWIDTTPSDAPDLGRCVRLLEKCPTVRNCFPTLRLAAPVWAIYIDHWDELSCFIKETTLSPRNACVNFVESPIKPNTKTPHHEPRKYYYGFVIFRAASYSTAFAGSQ
jgi:hypothetical protein